MKSQIKKYLVIFTGSLSWVLTMYKSGSLYDYGIGFWGANGHDGVWHLALINSLKKGSLGMPVFAGQSLKNYHIGYDLILAIVARISGISASILYFKVFPVILSVLIGLLAYSFVKKWRGSSNQALWSVFFVYFGSNFGWVITWLRSGQFNGESMFWSQQAVSTLINPPFALSLLFILAGLILTLKYQKNSNPANMMLASLFFGSLIQVKAYAAVLVLGGLLVSGLWETFTKAKLRILSIFFASSVLTGLLYTTVPSDVQNIFVIKPFWFLETMMTDRLGWHRYGEAMVNYRAGGQIFKAILAYLVALFIFWYGNMGTRFIQEILIANWALKWKKIKSIEVFIVSIILAGALIPMIIVQKGTAWNTIQFFYYSLFFSGILAGITLSSVKKVLPTKSMKTAFAGSLVILTIPTTIGTLTNHYLPKRPPAMIPSGEVAALEFLAGQENGVILTYPYDEDRAKAAIHNPPRPLYLYESTAYVSAYSDKPVFLEDQVNLEITNFDWRSRRKQIEDFFDGPRAEFLDDNNIDYIYLVGYQRDQFNNALNLEKIFSNEKVDIYNVK